MLVGSVTSWSCIKTAERIEPVFRMSFLPPIVHCVKFGLSSKIRVLPYGTLPQTPDLENVASVYRSLKRVINTAQSVINWTVVDNTSELNARPLVYHSNHQAVSTAQFHHATVDTCNNLPVSCNILLTVFASVISVHSLCVYLLYFYVGWLSGE